ncbi:MAG: NAD/NADP octopine/nopaline dehydrogenase family protein [Blastocatellia bacterium]
MMKEGQLLKRESSKAMQDSVRVLVCGTGSSAHVMAGLMSTKPGIEVRILTRGHDKATRWKEHQRNAPVTVTFRQNNNKHVALKAGSFLITSDPQEAAQDCDFIIIAIPAFLHGTYLTLLKPYIPNGCVIVGLPGQNGFEFDVMEILRDKLKHCVVMNFESLPWICRTIEFGQSVVISGTKAKLVGAVQGDLNQSRIKDPLACLQNLLGSSPELIISGHLLGITLRSLNAYSHPPIMYGRWRNWDGTPLDEPALFYQGIDETTAELLEKISEEVVAISQQIMKKHPQVDLAQVIPMYDWDIGCYGNDIQDKTNLMTALRTNSGYVGITHPMTQTNDGKYVPDFNHRFLTEDIPFGLVVIRGIAEIVGTPTPRIDEVLKWCQQKLGKEYLVDSKLSGKDLITTRCPQRYGFTTLAQALGFELAEAAAQ